MKIQPQSIIVLDQAAGAVVVWGSGDSVTSIRLLKGASGREFVADTQLARTLAEALRDYFDGTLRRFPRLPLDVSQGTPFQRDVWRATQKIPWGKVVTYAALAERMGRSPGAARAVGNALGANPFPIVVPCHRVVACNGLGGFGAGLAWKRALLQIEGHAI